jgi:hypothetical protein
MEAPKLIENLFYTITIVSTFTCIVRADYNFAFGLLCYYMIKTTKDPAQTARPLLLINGGLIIFDILWCITMSNVWSGKPAAHEKVWHAFDNIRTFTMILSVLNIFLRAAAVFFLFMFVKATSASR